MQVVPQYIDVEDRIAGPFTWKHIGWFFGCSGILVITWMLFDRITFYIITAITVPVFVSLAFVRPSGITMIEFVGFGFNYFFRPRLYTWQREAEKQIPQKKQNSTKIATSSEKKQLTSNDVAVLAQTLDSRGVERNDRLQQIMKERVRNNK